MWLQTLLVFALAANASSLYFTAYFSHLASKQNPSCQSNATFTSLETYKVALGTCQPGIDGSFSFRVSTAPTGYTLEWFCQDSCTNCLTIALPPNKCTPFTYFNLTMSFQMATQSCSSLVDPKGNYPNSSISVLASGSTCDFSSAVSIDNLYAGGCQPYGDSYYSLSWINSTSLLTSWNCSESNCTKCSTTNFTATVFQCTVDPEYPSESFMFAPTSSLTSCPVSPPNPNLLSNGAIAGFILCITVIIFFMWLAIYISQHRRKPKAYREMDG
eukprot:m.78728 g.78728  ORF g.78728 m.78728 type:complete len:272 (-) comp50597_c0_seq1:147-962(-)